MKYLRHSKDGLFFSVLCFLVILTIWLLIIKYQPFFGHMDDGKFLVMISQGDIWQKLDSFAFLHGKNYGYLGSTAFSLLLVMPIYHVGETMGYIPFYLFNASFVALILLAFMFAMHRIGAISRKMIPVGVVAAFLWPFTTELLFYPSLQEKGVLVAALLLFFWIHHAANIRSTFIFWLITIVLFLLGATSKTHIILFLPALAFTVWVIRARYASKWRVLAIVMLSFFTCIFIALAGLLGDYSAAQKSGTLIANAMLPYTLVIFAVWLAYALYLGYRSYRGDVALMEILPLIMMFTMWAAMVYFGYRNYFLSIFGPMFGLAAAVFVGQLKNLYLQRLAVILLTLATLGWLVFRLPQIFLPQHGIGEFTQGEISLKMAANNATIYTSCSEGAAHFQRYTQHKWGVSPKFEPVDKDSAYGFELAAEARFFFGDRRLCPAPVDMNGWKIVWMSSGDDGFKLYERLANR